MENSTNPRAQRLTEFIEKTGMSAREFAKQCGLKSVTSIQAVLKHNRQPSDLLLKQIIQRFPQLSYDWVILGIGEMYTPGAANESSTSAGISKQATFTDIQSKLELHDYALNELNNVIKDSMHNLDKKMDLNVDIIASVNLKIDTAINNLNIRMGNFISQQEEQNEKAIKDFEVLIKKLETSNIKNEKIIGDSLKDATFLIEKLVQTSMEAMKLGERALSENKAALKDFGKGLEGYAKERDKKAEEITLVNVEKLFKKLIELRVKGIGTFTKAKKS
tara:strand:- start:727 stop:1554 length:828 start_codon:yes stop_codon:yes gene_type:complete